MAWKKESLLFMMIVRTNMMMMMMMSISSRLLTETPDVDWSVDKVQLEEQNRCMDCWGIGLHAHLQSLGHLTFISVGIGTVSGFRHQANHNPLHTVCRCAQAASSRTQRWVSSKNLTDINLIWSDHEPCLTATTTQDLWTDVIIVSNSQ